MNKNDKIYVAGSTGMVGSAIIRELQKQGYDNIIQTTRQEVDLTNPFQTAEWFDYHKPDYVFIAAAKVGGIKGNSDFPVEFALENLQIQNNLLSNSHKYKVKKLLFLGSSCIYPKMANQPITEDQLLTSALEPTNEAYALAKIVGLRMCSYYRREYGDNFISCMPTNLYGINDNFNETYGHVYPTFLSRFMNATGDITCWGDGSPMREFLYVDDLAEACVFLMNNYNEDGHINIGTGEDVTIKELAELFAEMTDFKGNILWDTTKPNGTPRKLLDVSKINNLGWKAKTSLREGTRKTIEWYKSAEKVRK